MPSRSSMPSQSMQPARDFLRLSKIAITSFTVASTVLSVTFSSHTFSFSCLLSASARHTAKISEAKFSHSLAFWKPFFSMNARSSTGLRLSTKMRVTWFLGTTAAA